MVVAPAGSLAAVAGRHGRVAEDPKKRHVSISLGSKRLQARQKPGESNLLSCYEKTAVAVGVVVHHLRGELFETKDVAGTQRRLVAFNRTGHGGINRPYTCRRTGPVA